MIHTTVLSVGSLEVYTVLGQEGYFWTDKHNIKGCGPFASITEAMTDYVHALHVRSAHQEPVHTFPFIPAAKSDGVLIQIDFRNKRLAVI